MSERAKSTRIPIVERVLEVNDQLAEAVRGELTRRGIFAVDIIGAAGFEAVEAANADEAIEILESRRDITVVFTDIQMPGSMDGLKLARAVRGRWPPIKIVATSGRITVGAMDLPEGGRFLPKPYSSTQVTGVLRELISG